MKGDSNPVATELFGIQRALVRANFVWIVAYVVVTTAPYVYLDIYAPEQDALLGLLGFVGWGLGYLLFVKLMKAGGHLKSGMRSGIGTYFVLGFAIGMFVGLALIVLIVPGLYLLMRWLPAYSRALVSDDGVGNSMRWAWRMTEPIQRSLVVAMIGPVACFAASVGMSVVYITNYEWFDWTSFTLASIFWNGALAVSMSWLIVLGVAVFEFVSEQPDDSIVE